MSGTINFDKKLLEKLVPFFLEWDEAGNLCLLSSALATIWGDSDLMSVADSLVLSRPFERKFCASWLPELTDLTVELHHLGRAEAVLKGQVLAKEGGWLFVGFPVMHSIRDLDAFGLSLSDLPIHDGVGDLLIATEASRASLLEAQKTAAELELANDELMLVNETFSRFVPQAFIDELGHDSPATVALGDHVGTDKFVMFTDLREFTAISEAMSSSDIFGFINRYLAAVAPCVRAQGGYVCQYLGDGIMALFPGNSNGVVDAAIAMQQAMREFAREVGFDGSRLKMGIGIHFGHLELGVVGEAYRWDSSIIADAVNTASRVEGLTKTFAAEILVTDAVIEALEEPNEYRYRRLGMVSVKGRSKKVSLYELLDSLPEEILDERFRGRDRFEEALKAYEGHQDDEARALFEELLQSCPKDRAASFYLERLHRRTRTAHSDRSVYLR